MYFIEAAKASCLLDMCQRISMPGLKLVWKEEIDGCLLGGWDAFFFFSGHQQRKGSAFIVSQMRLVRVDGHYWIRRNLIPIALAVHTISHSAAQITDCYSRSIATDGIAIQLFTDGNQWRSNIPRTLPIPPGLRGCSNENIKGWRSVPNQRSRKGVVER